MGHQQRGRDALAGDVPEQHVGGPRSTVEHVDPVAADRPQRAVAVADLPAGQRDALARQQRLLDGGGRLQVLLEAALLRGVEAAEADPNERVVPQPVGLDRVVAVEALAEAAGIEARQGGVDLVQQSPVVGPLGESGDRRQRGSALEEIVANARIRRYLGHSFLRSVV